MSSQQNRGGPIPATGIQWGSMGEPSARLGTFVNWPSDNPLRAADLAEAGFIHMGQGDMVKCVYCGLMIRNFEPGDTAMGEHSRHSPECPFVIEKLRSERQTENFRQIFSTQSESSGYGAGSTGSTGPSVATRTSAATSGFATGTTLQSRWPSLILENSPIVTEKPRHPEFSTIQRRLATYNNWPSDKTQRPDMLSHAGFFYAGFNDNVKCFFCNGGLKNWEPGDEPWTEHARWFPKCGYVKQCKGLDFINSIKRKQNESAAGTPPPSAPASRAPSSRDRTSEALMKPYARAVMELGYTNDMVKLAIENRFRDSGSEFPDAPSLLDAIYELEEKEREERKRQEMRELELNENSAASSLTLPQEEPNTEPQDEQQPGAAAAAAPSRELPEEYQTLREENRKLKEERICKICLDNEVSVLLLPCAHLVACAHCAPALRRCPICRGVIEGTVRTYIP